MGLLATGILFAALPLGAAEVVVKGIRAGDHGATTRLVLDLSGRITFKAFPLVNPNRVVIDLSEVGWRLPARPLPSGIGVIDKLRYGLFKPGRSRVVLDVTSPVAVAKAFLLEPRGKHSWRLVVDLKPATGDQVVVVAAATVTAPRRGKTRADAKRAHILPFHVPPPKPQQRKARPVIAIDPGHGGVDPGAVGINKIYEKHVTLATARRIKEMLEAEGRYRVVLTRDRDVFVRLRDRVNTAREANADLFISLHADTIPDRRVRGLSVYTLSERASDGEAALLAERENKADLIAGVDLTGESAEVTNILIDLAQRETMNMSASFAGGLVKELSRVTRLLKNTHRFAGFAVLKAPDVPSVLVEVGFLSNRQDEVALRDRAYREKLARAIVAGIDKYFSQVEQATAY